MYDTYENLLWGASEFDLLGIRFSVDLENITTLNFTPILNKCEKILYKWKRRRLTPLGKITVVKTFILSSFNHIFSSLPITNNILVKKLNSLLYSFVWDNKPDKVNRQLITNSYMNGGLNMVNIDIFIKCQKVAWVKRLVQTPNAPWAKLFSSLISIDKFYLLGPLWAKTTASSITNPFWKEVLMSWSFLLYERNPANTESVICPVWYNPQISTEPLFYPHWYKAGIMSTPLGGGHIIFAFSGVRRPTWFPDILGNSSYPIFTKFGMQVYWVNSLYGIAFGDDSSIAN